MQGNEVGPVLSFEDRMRDRLRQNIGDVMTNDDLAAIVTRGLEDTFFKPRVIKIGSGYHETTEHKPPLIQELLLEILLPQMKLAVNEWVGERPGRGEKDR